MKLEDDVIGFLLAVAIIVIAGTVVGMVAHALFT